MILDTIFEITTDTKETPEERYNRVNEQLFLLGLGDRTQELRFFREYFKRLFKKYPKLESIQWLQYQDFNDNYLFFDLHEVLINNQFSLSTIGFEWFDMSREFTPYLENEHEYQTLVQNNYDEKLQDQYFENIKNSREDNPEISEAVTSLLIFLKSLFDRYRWYYFIYLFGRRSRVVVDRKGIHIYELENVTDYTGQDGYHKLNVEC